MFAGAASATSISVALVSTIGNTTYEQDVITNIQTIAPFLNFTPYDASSSTAQLPTVATLEGFQALMVVVGNNSIHAPDAWGNLIDTYLRDGHGVVMMANSNTFTNCTSQVVFQLCGNYQTNDDWALNTGSQITGTHLTLGTYTVGNPVFAGVTTFDGGSLSTHVNGGVNGAATRIASWSDGSPFAATRLFPKGNLEIALNFFPVSDAAPGAGGLYWLHSTQGGLIMANALTEVANVGAGSSDTPEVANLFGAGGGLLLFSLLLRRR